MIVQHKGISVSGDMFGALHIRSDGQHVVVPAEGLETLFSALQPFNVEYVDKTVVSSDEYWFTAPHLIDTPRGQEWHTIIHRRGGLVAFAVGESELESFQRACLILAGLRAVLGQEQQQ